MKHMFRVLPFLLALVLFSVSFSFAETIDLSKLSYDELVALKDQINLAIWNSQEWQEVTVPQGVWKVGEDIPAGTWTVTCDDSWRYSRIYWGELLADNGQEIVFAYDMRYDYRSVYNPYHKHYEVGDGETSYTFTVRDGDYIVIEKAPAVFTPYAGKPSLGFK